MKLEDLIDSCSNLIYKIASSFYGVDKEDLYQAGILGLLKAYKNFKQTNAKFSSYAYDYIYGEMYSLVNNKMLKVNKDMLKLYKLIEQTRYSLAQKNHKIPSNADIAKFLGYNEEMIDLACMSGKEIMSLDNDSQRSYYETIAWEEKNSIDDQILIEESLELLSEDERNIIKARYYEDLTQSEVAKKLAMTQVMVSRYEKRGLSKMQEFLIR